MGEHAELAARIDELWQGGDLAAADELYSEDFAADGQRVGPEGVKAMIQGLRAVFSEMTWELKDYIAHGERFVVRFEQSGRHTGTWNSPIGPLAATGRHFTVSGIEIFRVAGGRAVEAWVQYDMLSLLKQLGAIDSS